MSEEPKELPGSEEEHMMLEMATEEVFYLAALMELVESYPEGPTAPIKPEDVPLVHALLNS